MPITIPRALANAKLKKGACYSVHSHDVFSFQIAGLLGGLQPEGSDTRHDLIATCAYPPSFFYREAMKKLEIDGSTDATDRLKLMETLQGDRGKGISLLTGNISEEEKRTIDAALGAAMYDAFPHFRTMNERLVDGTGFRQIRLCFFGMLIRGFTRTMLSSENRQDYVTAFKEDVSPVHAYVFSEFLNNGCPCYVIRPWMWSEWGLDDSSVRDFALLDEIAFVEYHSRSRYMVFIQPIEEHFEFLGLASLLMRLRNRRYRAEWRLRDFLAEVYGLPAFLESPVLTQLQRLLDFPDSSAHAQHQADLATVVESLIAAAEAGGKKAMAKLEQMGPFSEIDLAVPGSLEEWYRESVRGKAIQALRTALTETVKSNTRKEQSK